MRMERDRPNLEIARRKPHALPVVACIFAAIGPILSARKDSAPVLRMHGDAMDMRDLGESIHQMVPAVLAELHPEHTAKRVGLRGSRSAAAPSGHAGIDEFWVGAGHVVFLCR